ncbi:MAG: hypothetical protein IJM74_09750, partial [Bacteroidales bacterium]|nr:hypothetical protein [Bacteroidales bacterium]
MQTRRILAFLFAAVMVAAVPFEVQAQSKKGSAKAKSTQTGKKSGKTKGKAAPAAPTFKEVELPYNANDCLFAIPLELDKPYGPTTAPDGGGRMQEVVADQAHPNLFEREHNSVWYKVKIPYNGNLEISIVQRNEWDDYDFLVYRNTGIYFSNQVIQNKVLPVAVNLGAVDSAALSAAAQKQGQSKAKGTKTKATAADATTAATGAKTTAAGQKASTKTAEQPAAKKAATKRTEAADDGTPKPHIGMSTEATDVMLTKKQFGGMIRSIPVHMGEEYYIVLDSPSRNCEGHTITVSVQADAYEPLVLFYDKKARKYVDVDLMILERGGSGERQLLKESCYKGGKVKFIPGFSYTLYAKKEGYFSIFREFNSNELMRLDTMMLFQMERTEKGSSFQIKDLYYEAGEATLIGNYDSVLMDYVAMFRNHPEITFLVKGYVQSYGVDAEADMLL